MSKRSNQLVAIFSKPGQLEMAPVVNRLAEWLLAHSFSIIVDTQTAAQVSGYQVVERDQAAAHKPAFVIVLGGDGTLLAAARAVAKSRIPILAINLGSLGFLTEIALADMYPMLEAIYENRARIEGRAMLHCQLQRSGKCVAEYEALNDVVVSKSAIARISDFDLFVNSAFVSNYKADGLILATPTGSTAYSLAAGGPILSPDVHAFVVTPVSSHALTNRPLLVHDTAKLEVVVKATDETYLTVDGQVGTPLASGDRVLCNKSAHKVDVFRQENKTFYDVLRQKLKWGER